VTKSGTNNFHGTAFEFLRNDLLNARQYFALTNSTLKRHQFGGVLGGPIVKNKLFFMGGYQGTRERSDPADTQAFVPTAAMLAGDFTDYASAECNAGVAQVLKTTFPDGTPTGFLNNRIDPALFDPIALNITKRLPKAQDKCGLVTYGTPNHRPAPDRRKDGLGAQRTTFGSRASPLHEFQAADTVQLVSR